MTREPDDAADGSAEEPRSEDVDATDPDDAELAALEASAEQARADARRAAQAVRLARRARAGRTAAPAAGEPAPAADGDEPTPAVSLAKPGDALEPADEPADEVPDDEATAVGNATADEAGAATADHEPADDDADADDEARVRRRPRRITVLATVFAVLAAVFVVIAAVVHQQGDDSHSTSPAAARDAALLAARQDIVVLNTLDYQDVDGGLQRWLGATTGTLHDQLTQVSDSDKQAIAASKSVTTASVLAAAVTQVDATKGNATVIASVQIVVTPVSGTATTKRNRFSLTMTEVGTTWKIGAVQQVPVTLT